MTSIVTDLFFHLNYGSTCTCCPGRFCPRLGCGPYGCQVGRCLRALRIRDIIPEPAMCVAYAQAHHNKEAQPKPQLRHHVHFQSIQQFKQDPDMPSTVIHTTHTETRPWLTVKSPQSAHKPGRKSLEEE